jgi:hypothetical protein
MNFRTAINPIHQSKKQIRMEKVYQTISNNINGNCLAAVWASLLNLGLKEVPNFVEHEDYFGELCAFLKAFGLEYDSYIINENRKDLPEEQRNQYCFFSQGLTYCSSIEGLFEATVYSPGLWDEKRYREDPEYKPDCHAVIVDKNFNIIHDPNRNYEDYQKALKPYPLADQLGYNGVIGVTLFRKIKQEDNHE